MAKQCTYMVCSLHMCNLFCPFVFGHFCVCCIVLRFRQARKRLEALEKQAGDNYYMVKEPKFQRKFVKLAKTLKPEVPGMMDKGISIIRFKNEAYHFTGSNTEKPRKRRSSSVVKSLIWQHGHLSLPTLSTKA